MRHVSLQCMYHSETPRLLPYALPPYETIVCHTHMLGTSLACVYFFLSYAQVVIGLGR